MLSTVFVKPNFLVLSCRMFVHDGDTLPLCSNFYGLHLLYLFVGLRIVHTNLTHSYLMEGGTNHLCGAGTMCT